MNVEFKEIAPQAEKIENIIANGEIVGEITLHSSGSMYYAIFDVKGGDIGQIQGHGVTRNEAIMDAIIVGRIAAEKRLESIAELEKKLGL